LVPASSFTHLQLSPTTRLWITRHGGHLGFIGASGTDADRRWIDWRIVDWVLAQHAAR
jgi:predicted alpha/beta-fold hydrolase